MSVDGREKKIYHYSLHLTRVTKESFICVKVTPNPTTFKPVG